MKITRNSIAVTAASAALAFFSALASAETQSAPRAPQTQSPATKQKVETLSETRTRRQVLNAARSWAIQLRFLDRNAIAQSPYDMIVMDHAPHPKQEGEKPYTEPDIAPLKKKPDGGRRLVFAYLSIGEAESYRYYWREAWEDSISRPAWLGAQNPSWPGNFSVKYADPEWQSIIFGTPTAYLDRIIAAGFDGVYLDRADAFQDDGQQSSDAEEAMVRFVSRICDHAHRANPDFMVVMQNAEELLRHSALRQRLDGIAKEDLSFGADNTTKPNPPDMVLDSLQYLRKARKAGMAVLTLEYVKDPSSTASVRKLAEREGFVLFLTGRLLDSLEGGENTAVPAAAGSAVPDNP